MNYAHENENQVPPTDELFSQVVAALGKKQINGVDEEDLAQLAFLIGIEKARQCSDDHQPEPLTKQRLVTRATWKFVDIFRREVRRGDKTRPQRISISGLDESAINSGLPLIDRHGETIVGGNIERAELLNLISIRAGKDVAEVIELLAHGHTQQEAAVILKTSLRSVERRCALARKVVDELDDKERSA